MKYPSIRFVFDRKKVATKERKGLLQIEIMSGRKRKFVGTGIKLYADQWDDRRKVVNCINSVQYNSILDSMMCKINDYISDLARNGIPFDFSKMDVFLKNVSNSGSVGKACVWHNQKSNTFVLHYSFKGTTYG